MYSFNILFIMSQCFARMSVISLIWNITPVSSHRRSAQIVFAATLLWTTTALFGLAFQCHLPRPWDIANNVCIDRIAFYTFVEVLQMIIDLALIIIPFAIVWKLKLKTMPKLTVMGCFLGRILYVLLFAGLSVN